MSKKKKRRGPEPDHLVLNRDWSDAVKEALAKKRPKRGWPKHNKRRGK